MEDLYSPRGLVCILSSVVSKYMQARHNYLCGTVTPSLSVTDLELFNTINLKFEIDAQFTLEMSLTSTCFT